MLNSSSAERGARGRARTSPATAARLERAVAQPLQRPVVLESVGRAQKLAVAHPVPILPHGATPPATLCLGGLGPGSRKSNFSPTPRRNSNFIALPSSTHRVLQLWSNRTWSTWLLFWSRKWPSEASNHHFFPLAVRGLGEGCALWGARKSSLTWGAARQKCRLFTKKLT